jgi:hypothetical protein
MGGRIERRYISRVCHCALFFFFFPRSFCDGSNGIGADPDRFSLPYLKEIATEMKRRAPDIPLIVFAKVSHVFLLKIFTDE